MSVDLPPCLEKCRKADRVGKVLDLIRQKPSITFKELHRLVCESLGVSSSTAYDYLRQAKEHYKNTSAKAGTAV